VSPRAAGERASRHITPLGRWKSLPQAGRIFDMQPIRVAAIPVHWLVDRLFPGTLTLGRARGSRAGRRLAFLVHGFAMNEDYFGLLVPDLLARGYDVWAIRLPGYAGSEEPVGTLRPLHWGLSVAFYGWVTASALAHLVRTLEPSPTAVLAWGHSLGAAAVLAALAYRVGSHRDCPDHVVLEAPAFAETLPFSAAMVAAFAAFPGGVLNLLARSFLLDDIRSSRFAQSQGVHFIPGRTSRLVLTMNALAHANPLSRTPAPVRAKLDRRRFVIARFDRLVEHDRLVALLDRWRVPKAHRLVLARNHLTALTASHEMLEWLDGVTMRT
jgi:alpha-beta hydrolase superfamily lysophospholipase